ncbi:unnamed protein product [Soboliphyme baturini]|uniref:Reverse transcriptase domain-containing protein n=1 Tax=Soboliphyme baturini TaxID=241478 RepID=A0A183ITL3_9BILA|nr:unnamed protein product [Soboliphyme baturini]
MQGFDEMTPRHSPRRLARPLHPAVVIAACCLVCPLIVSESVRSEAATMTRSCESVTKSKYRRVKPADICHVVWYFGVLLVCDPETSQYCLADEDEMLGHQVPASHIHTSVCEFVSFDGIHCMHQPGCGSLIKRPMPSRKKSNERQDDRPTYRGCSSNTSLGTAVCPPNRLNDNYDMGHMQIPGHILQSSEEEAPDFLAIHLTDLKYADDIVLLYRKRPYYLCVQKGSQCGLLVIGQWLAQF